MSHISFRRFVSLFVVLVLIHGIIFPQTTFDSRNFDFRNLNSRILDSRFDRADREITPHKWMEEARRGIESARVLWEEMIPELYRDPALLNSLSSDFNEWTEQELENRFTLWLLNRFFSTGAELLTIEVIREGERADSFFTHADEASNFQNDLFTWRSKIEDSAQNAIHKYELHLTQTFPELLVYIDENKREDFGRRLTEITKTAVHSLQNEFAGLISREERSFIARHLGNVDSYGKRNESDSASSIGAALIEEALRVTNEGIAILQTKIEAAETGEGDLVLAGAEWLSQYKEQFERGLRAWEDAEERFFIRRAEWEQNIISHYYEAETAWNDVFKKFDEARREWEYKVKNLFESGELLFKNASATLEKTIVEAKAEFIKDSRIRTESAVEKAKAWADIYLTASAIVVEAKNNLIFWNDRLTLELDRKNENPLIVLQEIENWTFLYNFYYEKAVEAKTFLENEFSIVMGNRSLFDVLAQGVSSEDFFLDEYQVELLRSQAVAGYWSRRVDIAQAVLNYAQDLSSGRITESEGIMAWERAKTAYDSALLNYQDSMDLLKQLGMDSLQVQAKMIEASLKLQKAEAELEELNQIYAGLILAYEIQKENYLEDEIANRNNKFIEIVNILNDTGPDSIMIRYLNEVYNNWSIQEARSKVSLLKELVAGGLYFEKSLAELSQIANNIKTFGANDAIPHSIEEFNIPQDNPLYTVLEGLLSEKDYYLFMATNEDEYATINEEYNSMIRALCISVKNDAIRQEQNRIFILRILISPNVELIDENQFYDEEMIIAYRIASAINPEILIPTRNGKIQNLYDKYNEIGVEYTRLIPEDISYFVDALISNSDDPLLSTAQFLFLLDDVLGYLPRLIDSEIISWKNLFIELILSKSVNPDLEINEILLNSLARKTQLINSAYTMYINTDVSLAESFVNAVNKYIDDPLSLWDENLLPVYNSVNYNSLESIVNEMNSYSRREQVLYDEILRLEQNLELLNQNDGSLELEIKRVSEDMERQKNNISFLMDEYLEIAETFSRIAFNYDVQYSETKKAHSLIEEMRHEYEIQDVIKRWTSTSYMDTSEQLQDLHISQENYRKAQTVMTALRELYSSGNYQQSGDNAEYNLLYEEYQLSYSELFAALHEHQALVNSLDEVTLEYNTNYEAYKNQLVLLGGDFLYDMDNQDNKVLQALLKLIKLENGSLAFSKDGNFDLLVMEDFENALLNLNQRLMSYEFTQEKFYEWGKARDYLLSDISIKLDQETIELLGLDNLSCDLEINGPDWYAMTDPAKAEFLGINILLDDPGSNENAWNNLSDQEKADLEFLAILGIANPYNNFFAGMSEFIKVEQSIQITVIRLQELIPLIFIPVVNLFYINEYSQAYYEYQNLIVQHGYLMDVIKNSYNGFVMSFDSLEKKHDDYLVSSEKLSLLKYNVSESEKILKVKKTELKEKQMAFEDMWRRNYEEHLFFYEDYLYQYELFMLGDSSIDAVRLSAEKAFGNKNIFEKSHLENIEQLILNNFNEYSDDKEGFMQIQEILLNDYIQLANRAYASRYDAELKVREAEWELQLKDLEEKFLSWQSTAMQILERGREDWKDSSDRMQNTYSLWNKTFQDEYHLTSNAWTAAYLEGLKDKETWVERATSAAEQASAQAMLVLMGSDAEAMARAMDTRDPLNMLNSDGINLAYDTLNSLLSAAGISKIDDIFGSINSIAGTVNLTIRTGLGMGNISDYGLIQSQASRFAKAAKEDIAARESVKIAVNLSDKADQVIAALGEKVDRANTDMQEQMDEFFVLHGSWRRTGRGYQKDVLVHSTFFASLITENAFIEGYRNFILDPVQINTDLSEERIRYLDSISIQILMDNLMHEMSEITYRIFGSGNSDDGVSFKGEFLVHIGNIPDIKDNPNIDDGKPGIFDHYGDGEQGRLLTEFYFWYYTEQKGLALLNAPPWDKPLWDSRDSFFDAPSLRTTVSIGAQIIAAVATGGLSAPLTSALINLGSDLVFNVADVAGGYKSWTEAGVDFGKSLLTTAISTAANVFTGGLTQGFANAAGSGAAAQFGANLGKVIVTGMKDITVGTINSSINAITYSDSNGFGWSSDAFNTGVINTLKTTAVSATSTFTTGTLNVGLEGFYESYADGDKLHTLLGGLAGQGVNYAMGGDFTLNLFNIGIFNDEKTKFDLGLLELRIGKDKINMGLGTGGVDASIGTLTSAVKGLNTWKVNAELLFSKTQASDLYKSQLRTLYDGDETLRREYENVLAGKTEYVESDNYYTQSKYNEDTGIKTIYLGSDALADGSRFGLNVVFAHEAYRNGKDDGEYWQKIETANAVYGHSQTAMNLIDTYGMGSLGEWMTYEASAYDYFLKTGNQDLMKNIVNNYDSDGDYWKLAKMSFGSIQSWKFIDDGSSDFDITELLRSNEFSKNDFSLRSAIGDVLAKSITDGKSSGVISAQRMDPSVAGMLGNAVISAPLSDNVFLYKDYDPRQIDIRDGLIKNTREKMAINAYNNVPGVYNAIEPYILGVKTLSDDGDINKHEYEYLVPFVMQDGYVTHITMDRDWLNHHYNELFFIEGEKMIGDENYVYRYKNFTTQGAVDCSGFLSWAIMETTGLKIPTDYLNANALANHPYLAKEAGDNSIGTVNFYYKGNDPFHHVTMDAGNGSQEINPYGGPANTPDNRGPIWLMNYSSSNGTRVNRQVNWHFLFFMYDGNAGNFSRTDTFKLRNYF